MPVAQLTHTSSTPSWLAHVDDKRQTWVKDHLEINRVANLFYQQEAGVSKRRTQLAQSSMNDIQKTAETTGADHCQECRKALKAELEKMKLAGIAPSALKPSTSLDDDTVCYSSQEDNSLNKHLQEFKLKIKEAKDKTTDKQKLDDKPKAQTLPATPASPATGFRGFISRHPYVWNFIKWVLIPAAISAALVFSGVLAPLVGVIGLIAAYFATTAALSLVGNGIHQAGQRILAPATPKTNSETKDAPGKTPGKDDYEATLAALRGMTTAPQRVLTLSDVEKPKSGSKETPKQDPKKETQQDKDPKKTDPTKPTNPTDPKKTDPKTDPKDPKPKQKGTSPDPDPNNGTGKPKKKIAQDDPTKPGASRPKGDDNKTIRQKFNNWQERRAAAKAKAKAESETLIKQKEETRKKQQEINAEKSKKLKEFVSKQRTNGFFEMTGTFDLFGVYKAYQAKIAAKRAAKEAAKKPAPTKAANGQIADNAFVVLPADGAGGAVTTVSDSKDNVTKTLRVDDEGFVVTGDQPTPVSQSRPSQAASSKSKAPGHTGLRNFFKGLVYKAKQNPEATGVANNSAATNDAPQPLVANNNNGNPPAATTGEQKEPASKADGKKVLGDFFKNLLKGNKKNVKPAEQAKQSSAGEEKENEGQEQSPPKDAKNTPLASAFDQQLGEILRQRQAAANNNNNTGAEPSLSGTGGSSLRTSSRSSTLVFPKTPGTAGGTKSKNGTIDRKIKAESTAQQTLLDEAERLEREESALRKQEEALNGQNPPTVRNATLPKGTLSSSMAQGLGLQSNGHSNGNSNGHSNGNSLTHPNTNPPGYQAPTPK